MASSYEKVCELYLKTPEYIAFRETVQHRLNALSLTTAAFDIRDDESAKKPRPYFRYKHPMAERETSMWKSDRPDIEKFLVDWDSVYEPEELVKLTRDIWHSKKVPTYNCKLEKSEKAKKSKNSGDAQCLVRAFPDAVRWRLRLELGSDHQTASARIITAICAWYDAPDYELRKIDAVETKAVEEIKAALLRYRHLDEKVLKRAFQLFLCEEVLDM